MTFRVLHIEDEQAVRDALREALRAAFHELERGDTPEIEVVAPAQGGGVDAAADAESRGIEVLQKRGDDFDLIVLDLRLASQDQLEVDPTPHGLRIIRALQDAGRTDLLSKIVVVSAWLGADSASSHRNECEEFLAAGVPDVWRKPIRTSRIISTLVGFFGFVRRVPRRADIEREFGEFWSGAVLGNSLASRRFVHDVHRAALYGGGENVLLLGRSGTGKTVAANAIHNIWASRHGRNGAYVERNMAALPGREGGIAMQVELFGCAAGYDPFGPAQQPRRQAGDVARKGIFERADGGTVFLDEIGAIPRDVGAALLKVIEQRRVERVGQRADEDPIDIDCRIIAATDADLPEMVRRGEFNGPLFHRLQECVIVTPSLEERREDIPEMFRVMLADALDIRRDELELSLGAEHQLRTARWSFGEIRLLKRVVQRVAMVMRERSAKDDGPIQVLGGDIAMALVDVRTPVPDEQAEQLYARQDSLWQQESQKPPPSQQRRISDFRAVNGRPDQFAFLAAALLSCRSIKEVTQRLGLSPNEISAVFNRINPGTNQGRIKPADIARGSVSKAQILEALRNLLTNPDPEPQP